MNEIHHEKKDITRFDVTCQILCDTFRGRIEGTSLCRVLKCYVISGLKYKGCITIVVPHACTRVSVLNYNSCVER